MFWFRSGLLVLLLLWLLVYHHFIMIMMYVVALLHCFRFHTQLSHCIEL